jgi:periplasmic protein TonB
MRTFILTIILLLMVVKSNGQSTSDTIIDPIIQMPMFPGGEEQYFCFIDNNIDKEKLKSKDTIGGVVVQFTIDTIGQVTEIKLTKSLTPIIDDEFLRIIKMMPKWVPGRQNGKIARVTIAVPLRIPYENKFCH